MTDESARAVETETAERAWYERCPKPVLFEIALQLAILANADEDRAAALARLTEEWEILLEAKLIPQIGPEFVGAAPVSVPDLPALLPSTPLTVRRGVFENLGLRLRWTAPR